MKFKTPTALILAILALIGSQSIARAAEFNLFARSNLVAWCIVPFDSKKRTPPERAEMVKRLGIPAIAYDWRAEHVPTFEQEILEYQKNGLGYFAFWGSHEDAFKLFEKYKMHPQIWQTAPSPNAASPEERVKLAAEKLLPLAKRAQQLGSQLGLYNHGGWGGEPENMVAICRELRAKHGATNVGIIYNLHHGHDHVDRLPKALAEMKPYLLCVNLNGMTRDGDKHGKKILPLGSGELDLSLLKIIQDSGYHGPIGILGHTPNDAEEQLKDNLDGLDWLVPQLDGKPPGPKPIPRTLKTAAAVEPTPPAAKSSGSASLSPAFGKALSGGMVVEGKAEYRTLPITVECRVKLNSSSRFNIFVASDPKASAEHWELYSMTGKGLFAVYQPGRGGNVVADVNVCDGEWHYLAAILEPARVRLFVDGKLVKDAPATALKGTSKPGGLAFGRLVEGNLGCDGLVDDVRISRGAREISRVPTEPLKADAQTIGLWTFDELADAGSSRRDEAQSFSGKKSPKEKQSLLTSAANKPGVDYWAVEDAKAREQLPLYQIIPAATQKEVTPHNGWPTAEAYRRWTRSHGGDANERFSALTQINRSNVKQLEVAWTFHSGDGKGNIQCNPVIVKGVMFAPTVGENFVAIDAATGKELWRFKPDGRPAFRGITWWPGSSGVGGRLYFPTESDWLYALDPKTGKPVESFGQKGRVKLPNGARVAPGIFERTLVIAGYLKDVEAFDAVTGEHRWTFHTVPTGAEFGADTWDHDENNAANCWGGMAMDAHRGIAYFTTGSPKPNFLGMLHRGDNLFANCVVAIDARTGKRLWHFQEIRHDIWDLDVPAPPILTTITRDGKKVDVVAAVTKIGNTLLLDRVTGKPIFPFRLRRAPTSTLPGEITAPYQPDVELPQPFARQEFKLADASERNEEVHEWVTNQLKSARFGWFLPLTEGKKTLFYNVHGGAEWTGACADPTRGRLYVTANEVPWLMSLLVNDEPRFDPKAKPTRGEEIFRVTCVQCHGIDRMGVGVAPPLRGLRHRLKDADVIALLKTGRGLMPIAPPMSDADQKALLDFLFLRDRPAPKAPPAKPERPQFVQTGWNRFLDTEGYPAVKPPWGTLNCLDLNSGKLLWKVPLGEYDELKKQGVPKTGTENFGGAIVTAGGLVFAGGTRDEKFRAFDAETGEELWSAKLPWGGYAPPATYEVNGRQFVVIPATGGGKLGGPTGDAYVAFALPNWSVNQ